MSRKCPTWKFTNSKCAYSFKLIYSSLERKITLSVRAADLQFTIKCGQMPISTDQHWSANFKNCRSARPDISRQISAIHAADECGPCR